MSHAASPLAAFHLIGDRAALESPVKEPETLRPALFAEYHDLSRLRTDFPMVLVTTPGHEAWVKSLSDIIDDLLLEIAEPGTAGEECRRQVLALEQVIRNKASNGSTGLLSVLWNESREELVRAEDETSSVDANLDSVLIEAGQAIPVDGEIIGFDNQLATRLVTRAWQKSESLRSARLQKRIDRLAQKLSDILKVNYMHSAGARKAKYLSSAVGAADRTVFDFQAMARILRSAPAADPLPASRKKRIQSAIDVLQSQKFVSRFPDRAGTGADMHAFSFDDCEQAIGAFRARLPEMAALIRAISIAELEIDNHYDESRHDAFFDRFDEQRLGPRDLELFPCYLVCIGQADDQQQEQVLAILRSGLPFKILAQASDILGDDSLAGGQLSFGTRGQQLARMALGLDQVFVLQSAAASLYRMKEPVLEGLSITGPALFSVFCGDSYLVSAAARESRAFPCFVYNPATGRDQAARYSLDGNPDPAVDWPVHSLRYENPGHELRSEPTAFTLIDFIAEFPRFGGRFAAIPQSDWRDELVPVADFLALSDRERTDKIPYVPLIDEDNILYRAVVDEKLVDAADRCLEAWHGLQELCGINNSHAAVAVTEAKKTWAAEYVPPAVQPERAEAPASEAPAAKAAPETVSPPVDEPAPSSNDPWIETIRCTTCNECTQLNDRMFGYDAEKRAYIKDPDAGTYRELVEAAETCQVAIIHPGKPRNPDEPGLEELLARAAPFL